MKKYLAVTLICSSFLFISACSSSTEEPADTPSSTAPAVQPLSESELPGSEIGGDVSASDKLTQDITASLNANAQSVPLKEPNSDTQYSQVQPNSNLLNTDYIAESSRQALLLLSGEKPAGETPQESIASIVAPSLSAGFIEQLSKKTVGPLPADTAEQRIVNMIARGESADKKVEIEKDKVLSFSRQEVSYKDESIQQVTSDSPYYAAGQTRVIFSATGEKTYFIPEGGAEYTVQAAYPVKFLLEYQGGKWLIIDAVYE